MSKNFYYLSMILLLLLLNACTPAIKQNVCVPARFQEASLVKEVAVLPFDGRGGSDFATEIEGTLASVIVDDKPYFILAERAKLDKIMSELKFSQSGLVDPRTAVKIGKMVGVKGIYVGNLNRQSVKNREYSEERRRCIEKKPQKKSTSTTAAIFMAATDLDCARYEGYKVSCVERSAIFEFTPKLIEVETGKIIYARTITEFAKSQGCDGERSAASGDELLKQVKTNAKVVFRTDVAPYYVKMEITLMDSKDGLTSSEATKKFTQGLDFGKNQRMDRACELWSESNKLSPNSSPSLLYNLGVCAEIAGDPLTALDLYKKADKLMTSPDDSINSALKRIEGQVKEQKMLKEQMTTVNTSTGKRKK